MCTICLFSAEKGLMSLETLDVVGAVIMYMLENFNKLAIFSLYGFLFSHTKIGPAFFSVN